MVQSRDDSLDTGEHISYEFRERLRFIQLERLQKTGMTCCDNRECKQIVKRSEAVEIYLGETCFLVCCMDCMERGGVSCYMMPNGIHLQFDNGGKPFLSIAQAILPSRHKPKGL